jgi:hypothetical protein
MAGNIIDSFWVALGFKTDTTGLAEMQKRTNEAHASMMELGAAIAGIAASFYGLRKVADIGSTFEQNRIQIAGFLNGLGMDSTFNAGLKDAAGVIQQITNDAAKLPGEADEYIEVFKAGLPFVKGAMPGGSLKDITNFTNKLTAIGKTFGLDAGVIAREFDHMLSPGKGMAGLRLPLFRQLMPFMRQVQGQANLTAESFNAMSAPARLQLLQSTFAKLQPMLDASADSFDAMEGALVSSVKQITRLGTAGLFEGLKRSIGDVNALFFDANGNLTETGKNVVGLVSDVSAFVGRLLYDGVKLVSWVADMTQHSTVFKAVIAGISAILAGSAFNTIGGLLLKMAKGFRLATLMSGLLWIALGLVIEDILGFYNGADSVTGMLVDKLGPGIYVLATAVGVLATAFIALKIQALLTAAGMVIAFLPVYAIVAAVGLLAFAAYEIKEHWQGVLDWIEGKLNKIVDVLNIVNRALGADDAHMNKHFTFADEHRDEEWMQSELGAGNGVLAPRVGPANPDDFGPQRYLRNGAPGISGADLFGTPTYAGPVANGPIRSETHIGTVNITGAEDPKKMANDWDDHVRDGQSKVAL